DWICEVISTSTGRLDRMRKMPAYAGHAVEYAWIVDPDQRTIESFHLENGRWSVLAVYGGDGAGRIAPFEAVELELSRLWLPESPAKEA
ncbi:MAG TPA: Uma2 family endonuclease, partial [Thermoanaerobaculia bacterium]|nr:Uma2 family endonuclease [Thermoanaerobaculia bacterium]